MKKMEIHVNRGILLEKGTLGPTIKKARFYLKKVVKSWESVHCLVKSGLKMIYCIFLLG